MKTPDATAIIDLRHISMAFAKPSGEPLQVLGDIDVSLRNGEILGLLGRSGSGKSTLLRIAGGLIAPTAGEVLYRGAPLHGPSEGIAVVFQTFALFPWLTVLENVEAGLDALRLSRDDARRRAEAAIDLIGLDGFQSAYPRELSGGMRQRVGFARALVTEPSVLLMDEPFSALDVLTAETLRSEFLDLWSRRQLPTKSVLLVTHNIEEAVLMCDRIIILSSHPGRIVADIPVALTQPRNRLDAAFHELVDQIYSVMTAHPTTPGHATAPSYGGVARALPMAPVSQLSGLMERLAAPPCHGCASLARLATILSSPADNILPLAEALRILGFAEVAGGTLELSETGLAFARGGTEERKRLFAEQLRHRVPLASHIRLVLDEREGHRAPRLRFETELEDHLTRHDAERTLRTVIGWGRYSELFSYDDHHRMFAAPAVDADQGAR